MTISESNVELSQMTALFLIIRASTLTLILFNFIGSLDPNKCHDCDRISILMLKLCATSISNPLHIPFSNSVMNGCFPSEWRKKANIIPVHKKGSKQIIKNYQPVSLLPICDNFLKKLSFILSLNI